MMRYSVLVTLASLAACAAPQPPAAVQQIVCPETAPMVIYKVVHQKKLPSASARTMNRIDDAAKASRDLLKSPPNQR